MLESAEAEFFGQHQEGAAGVAEAKPAAPQQAYFKSAKGGGGGGSSRDGPGGGSGAAEAAAQSKPGRQGAAGSGFKPARAEGALCGMTCVLCGYALSLSPSLSLSLSLCVCVGEDSICICRGNPADQEYVDLSRCGQNKVCTAF